MLEQIAGDEESLTVVCVSLVGIIAILVFGLSKMVVSLMKITVEGRLKQQMLDRGMTPLEIEQVLKAGSDEFKAKEQETGSPPVRKPEPGRRDSSKLPV